MTASVSVGRGIKIGLLGAFVGCMSGLATSVFLALLDWVTRARTTHPHWVYLLPVAGAIIGGLYYILGPRISRGMHTVVDAISHPSDPIPITMAPSILGTTLLTHIVGGSAGREGTAVQMGAAISDAVSTRLGLSSMDRRHLLMAGAAAGFGSAIGTPIAGAIFGIECWQGSLRRWDGWISTAAASWAGVAITHLLHAPHTRWPVVTIQWHWTWARSIQAVALALAFGLAARVFQMGLRGVRTFYRMASIPLPFQPVIGGVVLFGTLVVFNQFSLCGLSIPLIVNAFTTPVSIDLIALKALLTWITLGSGFKGGEFIPLVFIGTTLGSFLAPILGLPTATCALFGFAAVFGSAARTPITTSVMIGELFGVHWVFPALIIGWGATRISGAPGLYRGG